MTLPSAWTALKPHPQQQELWRTPDRFCAVACGRGSGKTELARRKVVRHLPVRDTHPDPSLYFYSLPTYGQAKRVAWDKLKSLVPSSWLSRRHGISESDLIIRTEFNSQLHLVGMDKPERIEGNQWRGGIMDESCDQRPGARTRSVRPALEHRRGFLWCIGVPKRFGCGASDFKQFCEYCADPLNVGYRFFTWRSDTVLSPEAIAEAKRELDPRDYAEQYEASWQSTSGAIFYAFDDELNVRDVGYDPSLPIIIGSDFNVDPMAWVIMHHHPTLDEFHVFDEIWYRNTNTQQTLDALYSRYGQHKGGWAFFGDASGQARKTSASATDYAQIRNDKRFERARVFYPRSNPAIADRFAACNRMICSASGERRVFVNPKCKHLIHDLSHRSYKAGTREPDDHGDMGHITDAFGYVIHYMRPVLVTGSDEQAKIYAA